MRRAVAALIAVACVSTIDAAQKTVKETLPSGGAARTYYLFVPDSTKGKPSPVIILLHGSGRDGRILVDHWESVAKKEGIILAGPDATTRDGWNMGVDGPAFFRDLVEALTAKQTIDPKRVYLFGHSAGAIHGLGLAVLESEYFAAAAVHAGVFPATLAPFIERAPRKIPMAIWVGTNDSFFPLAQVRNTRDGLNRYGFNLELTEIGGHTHNYYGRSSEINRNAWSFLRGKQLDGDPKYQEYAILK